jgi:iron complex transport system substrate-binding protein
MIDPRPASTPTARTGWTIQLLIGALCAGLLAWVVLLGPAARPSGEEGPQHPPGRIISMAPSITETLFALGIGERVVGVTRFCDFPPQVKDLPNVGGYFDPSYETITGLEPDLVILLPDHEEVRRHLESAGIETLLVDHSSIDGICESFRHVAAECGVAARGQRLVRHVRSLMGKTVDRVQGLDRPRVLIAVGRDVYAKTIREVFIAGNRGWYTELIDLAGGVNAYPGELAFPAVSAEGILQMAPDVIIEMTGASRPDFDPDAAMEGWKALRQVPAIRDGRVHFFREDFAVIPGPRVAQLLERLARTLHPDANWPESPRPGSRAEGMVEMPGPQP